MLTPPVAAGTAVVDTVTGKRWQLHMDFVVGDPVVVVVPDAEGPQRNTKKFPWRLALPEE